ncbi:MAG: diadenylate cyclase CdaA [Caldiserica bacterium]|jgi:diadenylate cyclase|nr:diadenylate cyclase CdaA [Caldisericota bacterium]MDH7562501.1 diadenylate cyclase CdaA [Caldisericota bacterium]
MTSFYEWLQEFWAKIKVPSLALNILDVVIISVLLFFVFYFLKRTRAFQLFMGLAIALAFMLIISVIAGWVGLITLEWVLRTVVTMIIATLPLVLAIIFQPELRHFFARLGSRSILAHPSGYEETLSEIFQAVIQMAEKKIGALIIIQRESGLQELVERGVKMDSLVSAEVLNSIFYPNSPLHDGAVVISGNRILAARVVIPLPDVIGLRKFGTRHLAAVEVTKETDAIAVVVSEQTGTISLAFKGALETDLRTVDLRTRLTSLLVPPRREKVEKAI